MKKVITKEVLKKEKRWCSKHQCVHAEHTWYASCRFPNQNNKNDIKN